MTKEELEIREYLNGGTEVPEHLKDLAEQKGFSIEHTTRQDYENLFNQEYADQMHIITGSQGALPLNPSDMSNDNLLPRTGTSAVDSGIAADDLLSQFSLSASPALTDIKSADPTFAVNPPAPQQAFTPA